MEMASDHTSSKVTEEIIQMTKFKKDDCGINTEPIDKKKMFWFRLLMHVFAGLLLGTLYYNIGDGLELVFSNVNYFYNSIVLLTFTGLMPAIITCNVNSFSKSGIKGYRTVLSKYIRSTSVDLVHHILFSTIYVMISYIMTGQPFELLRFGLFWLFHFLTTSVAHSLGLFVGAIFSVEMAVVIGPVLNIIFLMLSSFLNTSAHYDRIWLARVSYMFYGQEGAIMAVYGFNRTGLHCGKERCRFTSGDKVLEMMSVYSDYIAFHIVVLTLFICTLRIGGIVTFLFKIYRKLHK